MLQRCIADSQSLQENAPSCHLMPPRKHQQIKLRHMGDYGSQVGERETVKQCQRFIPIHSRLANAKAKQHHNTQTIPYPDEFVAVRSDATLCVALCKPRRPSVQLLQRESIRARWLEMARVSSAACGFIVLHYHIDLSLSLSPSLSLQRSCGLKEMKSKYSLNMFESS